MPPETTTPKSEQEEFLKDLTPKEDTDAFGQPIQPQGEQPNGDEGGPKELTSEEKGNRRERRLEARLQAERESSIALAARLDALTEAGKARGDTSDEAYLKAVERIYGTNTPETKEATDLLKKSLTDVKNAARDEALEMFREEQAKASKAIKDEEDTLDDMVEEIEDEFGVEIDDQTERTFFQMLEKMSPKDSDGNIIEYADHHAVWEELQSRRTVRPNRAKDLASRSMVRSGASPSGSVEADANEKWLRENGII